MGHWGWLIISFLFFGGLGAGAYLASFAAERGLFGKYNNLERAGYLISGPCIAIGIFFFSMNLGVKITEILALIRNPKSIMTWGIYTLIAFMILAFMNSYYKRTNKKNPIITVLGAILAFITIIYTGVQLSVLFAQPFWNTLLVPGLFVTSSLLMGLAVSSLLGRIIGKPEIEKGSRVNSVNSGLIVLELVLLVCQLMITFLGIKGAVAANSAQIVVTGKLALYFWILLVSYGLIFPLLYNVYRIMNSRGRDKVLGLLSEMAILVGGFILRAIIVFSTLPIWSINT